MAGLNQLWDELCKKKLLLFMIVIFSTVLSTSSLYLDSHWPHHPARRNLPNIYEDFHKLTLVLLIPVDAERAWHRRTGSKSRVELGPGSIKSPQQKYPEKYFEKKMKYLLHLQKRQEQRNKTNTTKPTRS